MLYPATLLDDDFERIRQLVYANCRINLGPHKRELVKSRLLSRLRATGKPSFTAYIDFVTQTREGHEELVHLLDAISTNKTEFFREADHFEFLRSRVVPELQARKGGAARPRLRVWSAACSSGEEPYSIAITLLEALPDLPRRWDAKILATDINTQVLAAATRGVYPAALVQPVPSDLLRKYFTAPPRSGPAEYAVAAAVRELVTFRRLNLIADRYPFRGRFDVVFCRNVMIYFDRATRTQLVAGFRQILEPTGYLLIGHSESLAGTDPDGAFVGVRPAVYQRVK